ncbi:phosphate signaling complex protein PhoU [Falsibacillus albus]|uniref:Phosphate-specific transport system accessory protein PhoU n=1 Tax=Falsibacillus albus TaxID=2478915 RepID=A0A3L7K7U8_9BACI|nr:phosphate signaling complex protein PhoU [Falsibacillus albus]RLQ98221.1 phosphate transport system regulatory protein PhoU [Falsibacillus albus]
MNVRTNFDLNLKQLKEQLLQMADTARDALKESIKALKTQDIEKANEIIANDNTIDRLEDEINSKALALIAKESPVATDLRKIIVAIKVSSEIERIGDMAVNIAKSTLHIGDEKHIKNIVDIPKMADMAMDMLSSSLTAFYSEDVTLAKECADQDDEVDKMYGELIQELMGYIPNHPSAINQITQLAFVSRYIERVADHATNISEHVIFLVTGKKYDLNA